MQRTEFATMDFVNKRPPFYFDDPGSRVFMTRKSGSGNQFFEERQDIGHLIFSQMITIYGVGVSVGVSDGSGVSEGVEVEVNVDVGVREDVGVNEGVKVGMKVFVGIKVQVGVIVGVVVNVAVVV